MNTIQKIYLGRLSSLKDDSYRLFCAKLTPTLSIDSIIGVKIPLIRALAAEIYKNGKLEAYIANLPHQYYEENNLHAYLIEKIKNFDEVVFELERFLPFVDNWATCDTMSPKALGKNKEKLLPYIEKWLDSPHTYTVRFAIKLLMQHYLDNDFKLQYANMVIAVGREEDYYIHMMRAWYFATALAKQYDSILPILKQRRLDRLTHNKAIQKAIESRRISIEQKEILRKLKY